MKQIILDEPGRFSVGEIEEPKPGPGEALVRVRRIGVCGTDLHAYAGRQPFFSYPRVLGHELGVEVVAVGEGVEGVSIGARCAVEPYLNCGACSACRRGKINCCQSLAVLGVHVDGGMRPYFTVPADKLHVSDKLSFEQLALVETLSIGAHGIERGAPGKGESTLVIGAGPIGLGAIQFALAEGANVAVLDLSAERRAFCESQLGVAKTFDVGDDLEAELVEHFGERPTLLIDATGHAGSMRGCFDIVEHGGRVVFLGLFIGEMSFDDPNFHRRELTLYASRNAPSGTLRRVIEMVESGEVDTGPWITHRLGLDDVPGRFADLPGSAGLIKAMIEVEA